MKKVFALLFIAMIFVANFASAQSQADVLFPGYSGSTIRGLTPGSFVNVSSSNAGSGTSYYNFTGDQCASTMTPVTWNDFNSGSAAVNCVQGFAGNSGQNEARTTPNKLLFGSFPKISTNKMTLFAEKVGNIITPIDFAYYTGIDSTKITIEGALKINADSVLFWFNSNTPNFFVNGVLIDKVGMVRISDKQVFSMGNLRVYHTSVITTVDKIQSADMFDNNSVFFGTTGNKVGSISGQDAHKAFIWNFVTNTITDVNVDNLTGTYVRGFVKAGGYAYFGYSPPSNLALMPTNLTPGLTKFSLTGPIVLESCGTGVGTVPAGVTLIGGRPTIFGTKMAIAGITNTTISIFESDATFTDRSAGVFPSENLSNSIKFAGPLNCEPCAKGIVIAGTFPEGLKKTCIVTPLPIKLISFGARSIDGQINVTWKTADETNFNHFELEKSLDGKEFGTIQTVYQNVSSFYSVLDENPNEGMNYYRLKMVDRDGTFSFSNITSVKFEEGDKQDSLNFLMETPIWTLYAKKGHTIAVPKN